MSVVSTEVRDACLVVTLNRPEKLNALNAQVLTELASAIAEAAAGPDIRAVVLTGAGEKAFCAGADLQELAGLDPVAATATLERGQRVLTGLAESPVPVIVAVNGVALGGGFELALAGTFTLASANASFGLPETGLGLIPGYGGTQRLPRLVGRQFAAYVIATGTRLTAQQAYERGLLVEPPLPATDLLPRALELAAAIATKGPFATRVALQLVRASEANLDSGLRHETAVSALVTTTQESTEGIAAFLQRRPARFSG